jgi:phosphatidylserine/phosphatidylglycerophosphate/cardiolipin synthase-like enzyme
MRKVLLFLLVAFSYQIHAQIDIITARNMSIGSTVTIQGIVTNGDELGPIRYIQDATGAIPAYSPGNFSTEVKLGDIVKVTGELKDFNTLLEIDPVSSYEIISTGNPLPAPMVVTPNQIVENIEGVLVKINNATIDGAGGNYSATTYTITSGGQSINIYFRANHPLIGEEIPLASVNVTGIVSQFNGSYQILPRGPQDIEIADNFFFSSPPVQSDIQKNGFTVSWETNEMSSSILKFGTDPNNLDQQSIDPTMTTQHEITLNTLSPGTVYYLEAGSERNGNTITAPLAIFATQSNSSGEIKVYFNKSVDTRVSTGALPSSSSPGAAEGAIIDAIKKATSTIDVAVYNNNRTPIVQALTDAHNRGVVVRYVTNIGTANLALSNPAPPFRVLPGNADRLMHNKFIVIDRNSESDSWLIMGSMNLTDNNIADDYNNMLFIQDQSLAKAFTIEFEEMWGGSGPNPGIFAAKFGENKTDNTPHNFNVNGTPVEAYFSPSDKTTQVIERTIYTADTDLEFALLTFTRNDLGSAIYDRFQEGVNVRGMIENPNDQGSEYQFFVDNGMDVVAHTFEGSLHHKYMIVDANNVNSDPTVLTGSHNWSTSAETGNDESTLVVHDVTVANLFIQEFEQRWCEQNTPGDCLVGIFEKTTETLDFTVNPNPVSDNFNITLPENLQEKMTIKLFDGRGQLLQAVIVNGIGNYQMSAANLPAGTYFMQIVSGKKAGTMQVIKI